MNLLSLQKEYKPALFELLRACLGEKETQQRNEAFWTWKHELNPFGPSLTWLAEEDQKVVGLRAFLRWEHASGDHRYRAVRAVDTSTHPDYQRRGIFKELTLAGLECARTEGVDYVFNTPNRNSMPGYLKMGWQHVGQLPMYVKILRPLRFAKGVFNAKVLKRKASVKELNSGKVPVSATRWLNSVNDLNGLIAADAELRGGGLSTSRSVDFLKWRYAQHPQVCYFAQEVCSSEQRAVAFCRENVRLGLRELMVSDILITDRTPHLVEKLLRKIVEKSSADYLIAHFGEDSAHLEAIKRAGFYRLPGQGMEFTVNPLQDDAAPDLTKLENWSLCLGDLEIF